MFENPRRGRQAWNFTTNVPKILDLKSSSEQIFSKNWLWVPPLQGRDHAWEASFRREERGRKPSSFLLTLTVWHDKSVATEITRLPPSLTYMIWVTHSLTRQERGLLGWHNKLSYSPTKQPGACYIRTPRHRLLPASKNLVFKTEPARLKFAS